MSSGINAINFDMSDFAEQIEFDLRRYLKDPEPGIYYGRSRKPFMKPHASEAGHKGVKPAPYAVYEKDKAGGTMIYPGYQSVVYLKGPAQPADAAKLLKKKPVETKTQPVSSIEDILKFGGDIHNHEGELVLRCPIGGYAAEDFHHRPIVSTIGYDVIRSFMDYLFDSHVKFKKSRTTLIGYVEQHFKIEEALAAWSDEQRVTLAAEGSSDAPRVDLHRLDLTTHIEEMLRAILSPITDEVAKFIATDPWFIYVQRCRNSHDLIVYKTQDFRVSEWTRLKEEGKI